MKQLKIALFGSLTIDGHLEESIEQIPSKALELFCFLLLNRNRSIPRNTIACRLWGDHYTKNQARKYLRKALWQLQGILNQCQESPFRTLLCARPNTLQLNIHDYVRLDVHLFEEAFQRVRGSAGAQLEAGLAQQLEEAIQLYRGDVLEGWHQDWCICERERLQQMYCIMMDKLLEYFEAKGKYELGLLYAENSLKYDRARECTHRKVMRMYYLSGDRTSAIRQYKRCLVALKDELDIEPSISTRSLYEWMCKDEGTALPDAQFGSRVGQENTRPHILKRLESIQGLQLKLESLQVQLQEDMQKLQRMIRGFTT